MMTTISAYLRGWRLAREDRFHLYYIDRDGHRHATRKAPLSVTELVFGPDKDWLAGKGRHVKARKPIAA